jgi:hypothetical protein
MLTGGTKMNAIIARRESNQNIMEWDAVVSSGIYTDCKPSSGLRALMFSQIEISSLAFFNHTSTQGISADADIRAGRVHYFDSIEEMISHLDSGD